jgi:hypothetical protein
MKKVLLILAISLLFSCNKDDDNQANNVLIGKWDESEIRSQNLNQPWSDWMTSYGIVIRYYFIDNNNVKIIYLDNTETIGTYTFNSTTNILKTNFPSLEFPDNTKTLISINANEMILQKEDVHGNTLYQTKYIRAND